MDTKIIPITELRRNFGMITENLARMDEIILTKGGEPFAILKATPEEKAKILRKTAGVWKGTVLDDEKIWKKIGKRKSRKKPVTL